jgi:FAD/FMN-containing dehydrogenase
VLEAAAAESLGQLFDARALRTDAQSLQAYGRDWTRVHEPRPAAVVLPASIGGGAGPGALGARYRSPLVPSGGRSGLSAGAVAAQARWWSPSTASTRSPISTPRTARCAAAPGWSRQQLQAFAEEQGLFYPVDFASSGSSQIGGNIATNAGGIKVIRYGMTRDWVAGLKVVTGSGELLDLNRGLIKNNAGYDLRQLMIGSEGTLGIIVEATMRLQPPPAARRSWSWACRTWRR